MSKKKKNNEPPSLFDSLDLFADTGASAATSAAAPAVPSVPDARPVAPPPGLTGHGPLRELFDFNFRQYSAYVICSRAIPAVEDGLKPVQRRILHSLWEKDDGKYTKVANIVAREQAVGRGQGLPHRRTGQLRQPLHGHARRRHALHRVPPHRPRAQGSVQSQDHGLRAELRRTQAGARAPAREDPAPPHDGRGRHRRGPRDVDTSILPHNFIELLEAEIALIQKKPFQLYPDFQTGGVVDVSEYQDGLGKVKVRAVIENRDKNKLVITALPWGKTTDSLIDNIEDAIKKKKVKVRKIHDLTAENVEIELELATGESQDKVKTALYAFTDCERSITSRPIVLDAGRPKLMTVTQILQKNVDRLMFLTRRELEIRLAELDDLFHARTLDRIFVEERIYKRIEKEKTYEGVQQTVIEGFKPYRAELRRDVTLDKNRETIKNILAEEKQVKDNLVHLRAFVVKYLKGLVKLYQKKYPRCTQVATTPFKQVDVRKLTSSELTIRYDKEAHFVGAGLKTGDELFKCSSLDKLVFVWKDGRYKMCAPQDKIFVDKDLLEVFLFNPEKDRDKEFVCVYEEPLYGFSYIKRFTFGGMINNKEYRLGVPRAVLREVQAREGAEDPPDAVRAARARGQGRRREASGGGAARRDRARHPAHDEGDRPHLVHQGQLVGRGRGRVEGRAAVRRFHDRCADIPSGAARLAPGADGLHDDGVRRGRAARGEGERDARAALGFSLERAVGDGHDEHRGRAAHRGAHLRRRVRAHDARRQFPLRLLRLLDARALERRAVPPQVLPDPHAHGRELRPRGSVAVEGSQSASPLLHVSLCAQPLLLDRRRHVRRGGRGAPRDGG